MIYSMGILKGLFLFIIRKPKIVVGILWGILLVYFVLKPADSFVDKLELTSITSKSSYEKNIIDKLFTKTINECDSNGPLTYGHIWRHSGSGINFGMWDISDKIEWNSGSWDWFFGAWNVDSAIKWTDSSLSWVKLSNLSFETKEAWEDSSRVSFSKTNVQKVNVDEWDIIKTNWEYIFYLKLSTLDLLVIKTPLKEWKVNLNEARVVNKFHLPKNYLNRKKIDLFLKWEKLIFLANSFNLDGSFNRWKNTTYVAVLNFSDINNLKLEKELEIKWGYFKSRLIWSKLYTISDINLGNLKNDICRRYKEKWANKTTTLLKYFFNIEPSAKSQNKELYKAFKEELESFSFSYEADSDTPLEGKTGNKLSIYDAKIRESDLNNLRMSEISFNIISAIDINNENKIPKQTLLIWDLRWGEIHMTNNTLYVVNSYKKRHNFKCKNKWNCRYNINDGSEYTLIHKLNFSWDEFKYVWSQTIPGRPINQYSMDESNWYFRIFTYNANFKRATGLYIFNQQFKIEWTLENIAPTETFKSSRFMWDKAYLVTFKQVDPLFVIDLSNPANPSIIGELKIPWFSSYLHPIWKKDGKEYLLWVGEIWSNLKVDLYEADYGERPLSKNKVSVKQTATLEIRDTEAKYRYTRMYSPVLNNPRAFVYDKEKNELLLPVSYNDRHPYGKKALKVIQVDINWNLYNSITKEVELDYTKGIRFDTVRANDDLRSWYFRDTDWETIYQLVNRENINFYHWDESIKVNFNQE